jgi:MFS family permease
VTAAFHALTLPHIYIAAFLSALAFVWNDAAHFGALPTLVGNERMVEANSIIMGAATTSSIVTPALGAWLTIHVGAANALALDAVSYALSAVIVLLIPKALSGLRDIPLPTSPIVTISTDIREGVTFLWQHTLIRTMTLLGFGVSFSGGALSGLIIVFAVRELALGGSDPRLGWFYTAGAVGAILTSFLLPKLRIEVPAHQIYLEGLWLDVLLLALFLHSSNFFMSLFLYCLWSTVHSLIIINGISERQRVTPEHLQSRVNAAGRMIARGGAPFGALVAGLLADSYDIRTALVLTTLAVFTSACLALFSPLQQWGTIQRLPN